MFPARRKKEKCFTIPAKKIPHIITRNNSDTVPKPGANIFCPTVTREGSRSPDQQTKKKNILEKMHLLDEMGFSSLIETKANPSTNTNSDIKHRFSIGISDFWTGQHRNKFIKEHGYEEAFASLKKKIITTDLQAIKSLRRASLPHIMDYNTKRRNLKSGEMGVVLPIKSKVVELPALSSRASEKIDPLDNVVEKCNGLAQENLKFKIDSERVRMDLRQKTEGKGKLKRKVTKHEKDMIAAIAYSMAV